MATIAIIYLGPIPERDDRPIRATCFTYGTRAQIHGTARRECRYSVYTYIVLLDALTLCRLLPWVPDGPPIASALSRVRALAIWIVPMACIMPLFFNLWPVWVSFVLVAGWIWLPPRILKYNSLWWGCAGPIFFVDDGVHPELFVGNKHFSLNDAFIHAARGGHLGLAELCMEVCAGMPNWDSADPINRSLSHPRQKWRFYI